MKIKEILEHKKNPLLDREEVTAILEASITPSLKQTAELISEKFGKPVENIVIQKIKGQFGSGYFKTFAKVYDNIKSKEKYEVVTRKHRKKLADEVKKVAEEAKQEKIKQEEAKKQEQSKQETSE